MDISGGRDHAGPESSSQRPLLIALSGLIPGLLPLSSVRGGLRPPRRRHRRLPRRQHHRRADLRQDRRELHAAPLPRPQGPFHNAGLGRRHRRRRLKRLDRDVFAAGATVLIVAYGVNDIGWGAKADQSTGSSTSIPSASIVEQCKARGVRVFICSAAITAEDPDRSEHGFLQAMCDEGMAIARSLGEHSIDVQRTMRGIQRTVIKANASAKPQDKADPPRRRRHPPERPRAARHGVRDPQGPGRAGRGLVGRDRRGRSGRRVRQRVPGLEPLARGRRPGVRPARRRPARSTSASSGPCSSATCRSPTS